MSILSELQEYIDKWTKLTGLPPTAIPVDSEDSHRLYYFMSKMVTKPADLDSVPSFRGCDIYFTEYAKDIREQTTHKPTT